MNITYLEHSGFTVELMHCVLVFDYYRGDWPKWERDKPVYVFVSHKHHDHFSFRIFDLLSQYDTVHYFLSSDVRLSEKYLERNGVAASVRQHITTLGKNTAADRQELRIRTLRSTDEGVAFLVETEGKRIYHAGDLNWWHWEGEDADWNRRMEEDYKAEIDKLAGMEFDAAFVPLDPRLEGAYRLGADYFMEKTRTARLFPMHLWGQYDWIERYKNSPQSAAWSKRVVSITGPSQSFVLEE